MGLELLSSFVTFDSISLTRAFRGVQEVPVGKVVKCKLNVQTESSIESINAYYGIKYNGTDCASKWNVRLGLLTSRGASLACSFIMPNKETKVTFFGGHAEEGKWVEDFKKVYTLAPPKKVGKPKACVSFISPSGDFSTGVGKRVSAAFRIKNCGAAKGNFYYLIQKDGAACTSKFNDWIDVGRTGSKLTCSFTMPKKDVNLLFLAGHAEAGKWIEDYRFAITASPLGVPTKLSISASFEWKDSRGYVNWSASGLTARHHYYVVPIKWVNSGCHVLSTWGFRPPGTTYSKESKIYRVKGVGTIRVCLCDASDIEVCWEGDYHSEKVLAYDDVNIPEVYPEVKHEVLEKCTQKVKVVDEKGKPVGGATVIFKGVSKKLTGADGMTSVKLTEGTKYTVTAEKLGYECVICTKTFTACTAKTITLSLKKPECTQKVKVVDEKGKPVGGATVIFKGVSKKLTGADGMTSVKLTEGTKYTVTAERIGYKCIDCTKAFTACTNTITLTFEDRRYKQAIKVTNEKGTPIGRATVLIPVAGKKFTESTGEISFILEKGVGYRLKITKEGYEDVEKTFTAGVTPKILVTMKKAIKKMAIPRDVELFSVVDETGNPVGGAKLTLMMNSKIIDTVHVKSDGLWTRRLKPGTEYTIKAEKSGYECVECEKTFTAFVPAKMLLTLKKKVAPPKEEVS